jgi:hypothetical protein
MRGDAQFIALVEILWMNGRKTVDETTGKKMFAVDSL